MSDWKNVQYKDGKCRTSESGGGGSSTLSGLDDVNISSASDGQVLEYDASSQKWKNKTPSSSQITDVKLDNESVVDQNGVAQLTTPNIDDLGKTAISNPSNGQILGYDGTEGKWKNVAAPAGSVTDVQVDGTSVVNQQGVAEITMPTPPTPDYPVTDVKVNGTSVVSNKQALITSYKEVTQAQYEALPDTKLSDNVLYAIKDGGQAIEGFPPLIYSDEEREVGVWRDGKPLYQKTIHWTPTTKGSNTTVAHGVQNIDIAIPINAFILDTSNSEITFLPNIDTEGGSQADLWSQRIFKLTSDKQYFYYRLGNNSGTLANKIIYFTFQYTKTTDTAGSGTWTTQGAIVHHYSTDEHVVGTWIDGKPLYERVVDCGAFHNIGSKTVAHNISDLKFVISYEGSGKYDSGEFMPIPFPQSSSALNYQVKIYVDSTNITIVYGANDIAQIYITLRYTKTTD